MQKFFAPAYQTPSYPPPASLPQTFCLTGQWPERPEWSPSPRQCAGTGKG